MKSKHQNKNVSDEYDMWNISKYFTIEKILKYMVFFDQYETIARFGTQSINEQIPQKLIPYKRKEALERCINSLYFLISNGTYALSKNRFDYYLEKVTFLQNNLDKTYTETYDNIKKEHTIKFDIKKLNLVLSKARRIYEHVIIELKFAGILARKLEGFDMNEILNDFIEKA